MHGSYDVSVVSTFSFSRSRAGYNLNITEEMNVESLVILIVLLLAVYCTMANQKTYRIYCYGDSLTAGLLPGGDHFPYAQILRKQLQQIDPHIEVNFMGLSGWTAKELLKDTNYLPNALETGAPIDVVILLAGTNDLGHSLLPIEGGKTREEEIFRDIWKMHVLAHSKNARTIAISVPGSRFQYSHADAKATCGRLNALIKSKCDEEPLCTYLQCPIDYSPGTPLFSEDGLHFSEEGYKRVAHNLVPVVLKALGMERKADEYVINFGIKRGKDMKGTSIQRDDEVASGGAVGGISL